MSEKLVLIDGHSILNRAFFGLPDLTNTEGLHTGAVYGFLNIMFKILEEENPDYLTVAFDVHAPTFRHKMYDAYKGTRKPMADELRQQVPLMKQMLMAMGVTVIEQEGYEADDVLGTIACRAEKEGLEVSVVSGDRDLLQLATDHIKIRIPKTKRTGTEIEDYYAADVKDRYQVTPKEFIEVKALMGDTADNIPGVPGIGEKTATALIVQYGSIEAVHEHAAEIKPPRASRNMVEFWDQAVMSKELATICLDAPIEYNLESARFKQTADLYTQEAYLLCKELEFKKLLGRFENRQVNPDSKAVETAKSRPEEFYTLVLTKEQAAQVLSKAEGKRVAFFLITGQKQDNEPKQMSIFDEPEPEADGILGMAICFGEQDSYLMQVGEDLSAQDLMGLFAQKRGQYELVTADLKKELPFIKQFINCGEAVQGTAEAGKDAPEAAPQGAHDKNNEWRNCFFDRTIAAYLLNPLKSSYPYDDVAKDYLGMVFLSGAELMGKRTLVQVLEEDVDTALKLACNEAYISWKSQPVLLGKLKESGMLNLFTEVEMPLVFVLSDMEMEGICMDADALREYAQELAVSIDELEKKIYEQAGETFNINSPKQLGVVLFEHLNLPNGKKTKTGYSTSAEVLDKLAPYYPIVSDILEYRQLTKLKSTYADGLPDYVREDGRIHTTLHQTITATGRLSSADPNLQNIPIRIELGRKIRKAFFPKPGFVFVDSDYSQIELRVLAHMSGDEKLIEAFRQKQDIHRTTASQVFHVPFDEVTPLQRRNAKAVNFGIVYGISAFGLAQDINIGRKEAQDYIDRYFATYPSIKEFLDRTVSEAKKNGQTRTLFGRIRPIPELKSSNYTQRQFGERVAMNSPIQGTASDIIKIAMIRVHDRLESEGLRSLLILHVHDELMLETEEDEKE
ncbi:MAG: DNA polymerase I [Clostridiales bacterium]|nr:DNA polymerase I [Clostridiales bacterium]